MGHKVHPMEYDDLSEIELVGDLIVAANAVSRPLTIGEVDEVLGTRNLRRSNHEERTLHSAG